MRRLVAVVAAAGFLGLAGNQAIAKDRIDVRPAVAKVAITPAVHHAGKGPAAELLHEVKHHGHHKYYARPVPHRHPVRPRPYRPYVGVAPVYTYPAPAYSLQYYSGLIPLKQFR